MRCRIPAQSQQPLSSDSDSTAPVARRQAESRHGTEAAVVALMLPPGFSGRGREDASGSLCAVAVESDQSQ